MITKYKQYKPAIGLQSIQKQRASPSHIIVDELPDEETRNGFMSREYTVGLLASLNMNVEPDDSLHINDEGRKSPVNSNELEI